MKVMILLRATADTEAGVMPSHELLSDMGKFNEELVDAGIMLSGEGLHPTSKAARVRFSKSDPSVTHGPYDAATTICGFWMWNVASMDEAIAWVKRVPNTDGGHSEIEIRRVFEAADFGEAFTPELQEQEEKLRERLTASKD
jgi:hypothetical protein